MADKVHISREEAPRPAGETAGGGANQCGLTAAMALIVGSIIGAGIFNLPASLAAYGPILFIVYSRNTGHSFWAYWAPLFLAAGALLLGIPASISQRGRMAQPAPGPACR